jgi:hypothetical protein
LAVILATGGNRLDAAALADFPIGTIVRVEFARGERAACAAATVMHDGEWTAVARALRAWGAARGWSVTVAPLPGHG